MTPAVRLLGAAIAAALSLAGAAAASVQTTAPSKSVLIEVLITDKGIVLGKWVSSLTHNGLLVLAGPIPRGDYVSMNIINHGKRPHDFTVFGKKTPVIKPGTKAHLFVRAVRRGSFPYRSTLDTGKAFRGALVVG